MCFSLSLSLQIEGRRIIKSEEFSRKSLIYSLLTISLFHGLLLSLSRFFLGSCLIVFWRNFDSGSWRFTELGVALWCLIGSKGRPKLSLLSVVLNLKLDDDIVDVILSFSETHKICLCFMKTKTLFIIGCFLNPTIFICIYLILGIMKTVTNVLKEGIKYNTMHLFLGRLIGGLNNESVGPIIVELLRK